MPKSKIKFYAVKIGRQGPKIYTTWDECKTNISRFPGAIHKSFSSRLQAEEWLGPARLLAVPVAVTPTQNTTNFVANPQSAPPPQSSPPQSAPPPYSEAIRSPIPTIQQEISPGSDHGSDSPRIVLSDEQKRVLQMVKAGKNVFFTGSAGTGKSVLLREVIRTLGGSASQTLAITASTGIASVNIGGMTIHSWAGIGLGKESVKDLVGKIKYQEKCERVRERWENVRTLIIDEVSMIDGALFDKLESIACGIRNNNYPFGGIQLVLSGDFCQLPPVPDREHGSTVTPLFAFDARSWFRCVGLPVQLNKVFRQREQNFVDMLNDMRFGKLTSESIHKFRLLSRPIVYSDGIEPTELYSTRHEVERANSSRLRQLPTEGYVFNAWDVPGYDDQDRPVPLERAKSLLSRLVALKKIELKVGAQVMLIKVNISPGFWLPHMPKLLLQNLKQGELVNGSVGKIMRFGIASAEVTERAEVGMDDDPKYNAPLEDQRQWPVVRFTSGREVMITSQDFTVNNAKGGVEARREQVPLILAWALSVHKSQGQTLERVKVDLSRTFEKGQAYVALSRATSMETLQVLNFTPDRVMVHPRVLGWHNDIFKGDEHNEMFDEFDNVPDQFY